MNSQKYGFTGKVSEHGAGFYLNIPENTVESSGLKDEDLLKIELRNQKGKTRTASRKVQVVSDKAKIYLPKELSENLELQHKDLVDVLFEKD